MYILRHVYTILVGHQWSLLWTCRQNMKSAERYFALCLAVFHDFLCLDISRFRLVLTLPSQICKYTSVFKKQNVPCQWRIQDFPEGGGANSQSGCVNLLFGPKTAWKWKNLDPQGLGARPWRPPDPPLSFAKLTILNPTNSWSENNVCLEDQTKNKCRVRIRNCAKARPRFNIVRQSLVLWLLFQCP